MCCVLVHSPIVDFTGSLDRTEHEVDAELVAVKGTFHAFLQI